MDSFNDQRIEMQPEAGPNHGLKNERCFKLYNDTNHEGVKKSIQISENNERETKCIQENSKSKTTGDIIGFMKYSRNRNNTDKCPKCGALKILSVLISVAHGVDESAVICEKCDTHILACARVCFTYGRLIHNKY